jgi:retron-type reverse transcriptase
MGAPTSPAISNLVLKPCDIAISKVSKKLNVEYSRYADDLTFSGNGGSINILPFVKEVLAQKSYQLDSKKTNIFRKGRRQCVTGLVVNKQISIARPIRKRIRASVHNACQKKPIFWHDKPMSIDELMGRIAFLHQVHPHEAEIYKNKLQENKLL